MRFLNILKSLFLSVLKFLFKSEKLPMNDELERKIYEYNYFSEKFLSLWLEVIKLKVINYWQRRKAFLFKRLIYLILLSFLIGYIFKISMPNSKIVRVPYIQTVVQNSSDTTHTLERFLYLLRQIELGNDYSRRRPGSQFLGAYQIGLSARKTIGLGGVSDEEFLKNKLLQDAAIIMLLKHNSKKLKKYIDRYDNRTIRGYWITKSGILAMAHNAGCGGVKQFFASGCRNSPKDGLDTKSAAYLTLSGFDINLEDK